MDELENNNSTSEVQTNGTPQTGGVTEVVSAAIQDISGFSKKVLTYFMHFLETDFKRQQAPCRRIQSKSEAGFRLGVPLRKYPSLYKAAWDFASDAPAKGLKMLVAPGRYTAPMSPTLRSLISQHINEIDTESVKRVSRNAVQYAILHRSKAAANPERFVEAVQTQFVEEVGANLVHPLLALLEGTFKDSAYSAVESVYDIESDLTDALSTRVVEALPEAVNTLIVTGRTDALTSVFVEFFREQDVKQHIKAFFEDFSTSDAFQEIRDLYHAQRSADNQSLYLYFCEIRFGSAVFPLFYIPSTLEYDEEARAYSIDFDPHLYINKQAVDWILQERAAEAEKVSISPVKHRKIYLEGERSFLDEMSAAFAALIPAFDIAREIDLRKGKLQQVSSASLRITTACWFSVFDKSDESLLNDYEELLDALQQEEAGAARMFNEIVKGFLFENPKPVTSAVDRTWEELPIADRLVVESPIPLNEEQRKIVFALKDPGCNYVIVQGPPGTGKSHTITALAFEGITSGKKVLVLSDKTEALDVVQDKLESVLSKVRQDEDFPNPILRLGKSGNNYHNLIRSASKEKIKSHFAATKGNKEYLAQDIEQTRSRLQREINTTVEALSSIEMAQIEELFRIEQELDALNPSLVAKLQSPESPDKVPDLALTANALSNTSMLALERILAESGCSTVAQVTAYLKAWRCANEIASNGASTSALAVFTSVQANDHQTLLGYLAAYEELRRPIIGWLFQGGKLRALDMRLGAALNCQDPTDLHKRLDVLKSSAALLGVVKDQASRLGITPLVSFIWRTMREDKASDEGAKLLYVLLSTFAAVVGNTEGGPDALLAITSAAQVSTAIELIKKAARYAFLWREIAGKLQSLPQTDYLAAKTKLERLHTARMTFEIDRKFLDFVDSKRATSKEIGGVLRKKQKFPEEEFPSLSGAFPVIIAGIRDYADFVPLKQSLFDLVIIDEASQVSVAQALPALLRAKKVVVLGDTQQFSNVKSSQAKNTINSGWLTDIEAYFREHISDAATKIDRLKHFDVKKSILEFFDLIANYETMLRKHFRGYQELISYSSKFFYRGNLQAIKIRSKPISEVLRFEVLEDVETGGLKNTNRAEANFILTEMKRLIDANAEVSVGVITPFREQMKLLNDVLLRDAYADRFESELHLKIMTFDTCQGEERDLIIYSMVATPERDVLNYIFPTALKRDRDLDEDKLKAQRLNVGFSRAKEEMLFVLSKPVEDFKGSLGEALRHFHQVLTQRSRPEAEDTDPHSPMERRVLEWLYSTPFMQHHEDDIEVIPQFPVGEYLKQLDKNYSHPAYRCDFLVRYDHPKGPINVIIEYDGFAEHFIEREHVNSGNWDRYYRPEDIERQMVIESYGYKFLRINRFNLGTDPVSSLSERLYSVISVAEKSPSNQDAISRIHQDAEALGDGSKKECPKCQQVRPLEDFWDPKLKSGNGGYGRNCMHCKPKTSQQPSSRHRWRHHYR